MTRSLPSHAVILAAGFGSRLQAEEGHKLLVQLGQATMLTRHLANFERLGVTAVTVVTGFRHEALERAVAEACVTTPLEVRCAYNPDFERSNGLSVLAGVRVAREAGADAVPFWLTMADHVFDPRLFDDLVARAADDALIGPEIEGALFVDAKLETIFDMPDATKVALDPAGKLSGISKELDDFSLVDVGLFWCGEGFVQALAEEFEARDDCSTSDAVRRLSARDAFAFLDIGEATWQDVDTPEARAFAEGLLVAWGERL